MTSLKGKDSIIILACILFISAWTKGGPLKPHSLSLSRTNPMSDVISATNFHHLEFYCNDATNVYSIDSCGRKNHLTPGNHEGNLVFRSRGRVDSSESEGPLKSLFTKS